MNVRSIFRPWVVSVDGDERLADAAERMHNEQVGSVVVMVGGRFAGILTERDLTAAIGQGADPATTRCRTRLPGSGGSLARQRTRRGSDGWHRGGFYTARWVDRRLFGQTGPAPPSWLPTYNGRWR